MTRSDRYYANSPGYTDAYSAPTDALRDHPEPPAEHPDPCRCGGVLHERNAAWDTQADVVCQSCGRGGHIDADGQKHGPAFVAHPHSTLQQ